MTIDEARRHIGGRVVHRIGTAGVVTAVTDSRAFVRWDGDAVSSPADPADLTLLAGVTGDGLCREARALVALPVA